MVTLNRWRIEAVTLASALQAYGASLPQGDPPILFLYSVERAALLLLDFQNGRATDSRGEAVQPDALDAFEARAFSQAAELRWRQTVFDQAGTAIGPAVVLSEQDLALDSGWRKEPEEEPKERDTIPQRYLLWGQTMDGASGLAPGWSRLFERRVGPLDVPVTGLQPGDRVQLTSVEYVKSGEDGNAYVVDERLVGLTTLDQKEEA